MTDPARAAARHELLELRGEIAQLHSRGPDHPDWDHQAVISAHDEALDEALVLLDAHLLELGPRLRRDEIAD